MMTGWFKVWRELLERELWLTEPFTRGQAFVDLIGLANHADGFIRVRGNRIGIKRGQCGWSEVKLSERWKWSRGRVRRFLSELENDARIVQQKNRITSVISFVNYEQYQGNGTTDSTTDGQQTVQQTVHEQEEYKKEKKEKKDKPLSSDSVEIGLATLLFDRIRSRKPDFREPNLQRWARHIDLMIRCDGRKPERIEQVIRWAQTDTTPRGSRGFCWAKNILSTEKLREKFDRLEEEMGSTQGRATVAPVARGPDGLTPRERAMGVKRG